MCGRSCYISYIYLYISNSCVSFFIKERIMYYEYLEKLANWKSKGYNNIYIWSNSSIANHKSQFNNSIILLSTQTSHTHTHLPTYPQKHTRTCPTPLKKKKNTKDTHTHINNTKQTLKNTQTQFKFITKTQKCPSQSTFYVNSSTKEKSSTASSNPRTSSCVQP